MSNANSRDQRRPKRHVAEQFMLFADEPVRRHKASIVDGDETDPAGTIVIDGTRTAEGGGTRKP